MGLYGYFVELKNGAFGELSILLLFLFYKSSLVCTFDNKFLNEDRPFTYASVIFIIKLSGI